MYKKNISINTDSNKDTFVNITEDINNFIQEKQIDSGICYIISPHTTCSVFYEEFSHDITEKGDEFLLADLSDILEYIVPIHNEESHYRYPGPRHLDEVRKWENASNYLPSNSEKDLWNGDAHIKSSILGSSIHIDIEGGKLNVGKTGSIYFVDFDRTRERERKCTIILHS